VLLRLPRRSQLGVAPHVLSLDEAGVETIAVMPIPAHGLGEAINDRLKRASSPATIPVSAELP